MLKCTLTFLTIMSIFITSCEGYRSQPPRILIFSKTTASRDTSIHNNKKALIRIGSFCGFISDTTENANYFNEDSLKKYSAVIFLNTTDKRDSLLNAYQENAFERYIQAGGGYVGIQSAEAEFQWGWYQRLLRRDGINDLSLSWHKEYDGGRVCYIGAASASHSIQDDVTLKRICQGIKYAVGENEKLDYSKVHTAKTPREEAFIKEILKEGVFFEPVEMTILPSLDILIAQRRGEILLYKKKDSSLTRAGFLNVYHTTHTPDAMAEEGLMGIQQDPQFIENHFIYVFYSPVNTSVNRLSRFTYIDNKVEAKSEKVILQFYSQREICCHTGGSIAFGTDNMLYLSTGDNTTPFNEHGQQFVHNGFGPLDDRPGHLHYDAARTAGNSNDLRGKILRIKIKEDGAYEIPDGNLFPKGQIRTKPEIYVMGNRNPYRISVDKRTNTLYWGEVGPDAFHDSANRGPKGYDEINKAHKAGYYGWPFFTGNNYPYLRYDYDSGKSGEAFDPLRPMNTSRNNTGLRELPPAIPPFIYYSYDISDSFPQLGSSGKNAMAGPLYYSPDNKLMPDYYNGKLFIYDWVRGWIKAVSFQQNGAFDKMEPFMGGTHFNSPIDMEVGPDGKLYILEYGNGWFVRNADACLSRIDYHPEEFSSQKITKSVNGHQKASIDSAGIPRTGHQQTSMEDDNPSEGKLLIASQDCKVCHKVNDLSVGPSFKKIAEKYRNDSAFARGRLIKKIINGGSGVWGQMPMPAHPSLTEDNVGKMIRYIFSLSEITQKK